MIVAVLDTNVLASGVAAIARPQSAPGELLRRWLDGTFALVVSEPILAELVRTLTNPYFAARLPSAEIEESLARLRTQAHIQPITARVSGVASHAEDDMILATALSAGADFLVTGDKRLLERGTFRNTRIISPRQFLHILEGEEGNAT